MSVAAAHLRHHHFSFIRAVLEGIPLRRAWHTYMAFEGGPDDERHFQARLRQLLRQVAFASVQNGMQDALGILTAQGWPAPLGPAAGRASDGSPGVTPPPPAFEDWVSERCDQLGIDVDFQTQAEWLAEYADTFGVPADAVRGAAQHTEARPMRIPATAWATPKSPWHRQLEALNELATALARPPRLDDALATWLAPGLSAQLARSLGGHPTVSDLVDFINHHHHRWWARVPGLGQDRAHRLLEWLSPLAAGLGRPLAEVALKPLTLLTLERARTVPAHPDRACALPWPEWLPPPAYPDELAQEHALIAAWLLQHEASPRTHGAYQRVLHRFHWWCQGQRRLALSSVQPADLAAYRAFLAEPPAHWVQPRRIPQGNPEWRPLKGGLGEASLDLEGRVLHAFFAAMAEAGHIRFARPSSASERGGSRARRPAGHRFDARQWAWVQACWEQLYAEVGPQPGADAALAGDRHFARAASLRRTRLALELAATSGMGLSELVGTRCGPVRAETSPSGRSWRLTVRGRGHQDCELELSEETKRLLECHHADMTLAETHFHPQSMRLRSVADPAGKLSRPLPSADGAALEDWRPLIGALRPGPPRWELDEAGRPVLNRRAPRNADRFGALDPTALHQALKRFFARCAGLAQSQGAGIDVEAFHRASVRWLKNQFVQGGARGAASAGEEQGGS